MAIIVDIQPELKEDECIRIVDRHKRSFSYPPHRHNVMELNFIEKGGGARRTVRDCTEYIGDYDLVLFGENLEHSWDQGHCTSEDIRELTIHFDGSIFLKGMQGKRVFENVITMLNDSAKGLSFGMQSILSIYNMLTQIVDEKDHFEQIILFERILHSLADSPYRILTRLPDMVTDYTNPEGVVTKVKTFIQNNYGKSLSLKDIAGHIHMPASSLSRLFKLQTGITVYDYLIQTRLEKAARKMIDSTDKIKDIAKQCGFNNISNFNRTFKANCDLTPRAYRETFQKHKKSV